MVAPLYTTESGLLFHAGKILVLTIGLPARGKTHISRALERYLRWMGVKTAVVSLGDYRRKVLGGSGSLPVDYFTLGEKSSETQALRKKIADDCEQLIWQFFGDGGQVVIYDANNGTKAVRNGIAERFEKQGIHVIMMESICNDHTIIENNIRSVKISSPDYKNWNPDKAVEDYYQRIRDHEKYYETIDDKKWPFIQIFDVGEKIIMNNIHGYLQSRIVFFLMNIHNKFRIIYFARSGQSLIEHSYKADADLSPAGWEYAEQLKNFVLKRRQKCLEGRGLNPNERKLVIWTSTHRRAAHTAWPFLAAARASSENAEMVSATSSGVTGTATPLPGGGVTEVLAGGVPEVALEPTQRPSSTTASGGGTPPGSTPNPAPSSTAAPASTTSPTSPTSPSTTTTSPPIESGAKASSPTLNVKVVEKPQMLEINPGIWDGLSPEQARKYYPGDWKRFISDPYSYRVPRAESYHDLSVRIDPVLIELEKEQEDLLIIGHASVIRCMLAYLIGLPASEIPAIEIARGDLLEVIPASYGVQSQAFHFWDGQVKGPDPMNFYEVHAEGSSGVGAGGGVGGSGGGGAFSPSATSHEGEGGERGREKERERRERGKSFWESIAVMNNQKGVFEDVQQRGREPSADGDSERHEHERDGTGEGTVIKEGIARKEGGEGVQDGVGGESGVSGAALGAPEIRVMDVSEAEKRAEEVKRENDIV